MNNDFYLSIIPIGKVDWHKFLERMAFSVHLNTNAYKCCRYFSSLESKEQPKFFPNDEAINLKDDIKFRVVVNYNILSENNSRNSELVLSPWHDEKICYKEASWFGADRMVEYHSNYIIILRENYYSEEYENIISEVIEICNKHNKKYKIVSKIEELNFEKIYDYFTQNVI